MSAVTGPPSELDERRDELTPMLQQYVDRCREHDDALVLFRVGDFYKTFCEIAEEVARICELTMIEREDSTGTYTAAGIPVDNAAEYVERLLDAGHRIAIADQVEDPSETNGIVERAVTRIVTSGTVVDDELLSPDSTYVAAVVGGDGGTDDGEFAVASVDVSTGECRVAAAPDRASVREEVARVGPAELLAGPGAPEPDADCPITDWDDDAFAVDRARETLDAYADPDRFATVEARAVGGLLAYAEYTQGDDGALEYVSRVQRYDAADCLRLDAAALRSLELFENRAGGERESDTLFETINETVCALGRRRLASWLRRPLVDRRATEARLDAVDELATRTLLREELRDELSAAYDLERLVSRVSRERANARDLRSVAGTLAIVPELKEALADAEADRLGRLRDDLDELGATRELIENAIAEDPPQEITEGGVIRDGFDDELDEVRRTEREGRAWVADLEAKERERTGIDNLEVGHNQVHGYYIEVTDSHLDSVPEEYRRRQTLKNSERFVTPELRRREDEILGAAERADALEYEIFCEVRAEVADAADRLQGLADALATLDALLSLATVAVGPEFSRPAFHDGDQPLEIEAGRHPVVARAQDEFVPNDAELPAGSVALVTGPNMSGKSTYMRQVGLISVLAQAGGFVPADSASLPVLDRVFTRVGASDDIAGGQSTFMREMSELTDILHDATEDSLVLLDEVGRGTSTADGLAIARAATEFLHDEVGARTMFATHYHDLTALADERDGVFNLHFTAIRDGDDVTFLHRVDEGPSSSSYGVEVARMAGVPDAVVERSRALVESEDEATTDPAPSATQAATDGAGVDAAGTDADASPPPGQQTLPGTEPDGAAELQAIAAELRGLDLARTTPLEALNRLQELQDRVTER
ncbi:MULTISPECIES: DNA mismatch repair protein MutS [Halolamina]|uniref:DNA mismatch repair protein MutS n=1 Tax=Halolamina pelagica TaxID=699431 RepID=A0A1I5PX82_9EURY|nr:MULTISPECIES: DNA mismatch repair protein MutS [Halolamina]NHX34997.1 DNA mismatch repair protein MutS [Halolamina sp. R1-12]SFP38713.1 DNA mismatch repair protein MutS [Halolamina pelagica]